MNTFTTSQPNTAQADAAQSPRPIHYVIWRSTPGGAELTVRHYIEGFGEQRRIHVYGLRGSENELYDSSKINFQRGSDKDLACYLAFFRYCRRHRKDIFHLKSVGPVILLLALLAGVRGPLYHIHGTIYWKKWYKKPYLKAAWWLSSRFRVAFIANSRYSAGIFRRDVLPLAPGVIYNAVETEKFLEKRFLRTGLRRLGYAGRLDNGKNVDLVIRLFGELAGSMPELELHLAGEGPLRPALERQAAASPFRDRIIFHGWVRDIPAFYASIDLLLFISTYESFGNVLAEALLTGLPVLTSDIPVFSEIDGGDPAFRLGDPARYPELRRHFLAAVANYPDLARKAFAMRARIEDLFGVGTHLRAISRYYDDKSL